MSERAAIAPWGIFSWVQSAGNWQQQAADTAAAVNKSAAMVALKHRFTQRSAGIAGTYRSMLARTKWDLIDCFATGWDLYGAASSHGQVVTSAGVRLNAARALTGGYREYSFERFDLLADTDVVLTTSASLPFLKKQPAFTRLPAVKAGHVYPTDLFFQASYGIALALLDDLADICAKVTAS